MLKSSIPQPPPEPQQLLPTPSAPSNLQPTPSHLSSSWISTLPNAHPNAPSHTQHQLEAHLATSPLVNVNTVRNNNVAQTLPQPSSFSGVGNANFGLDPASSLLDPVPPAPVPQGSLGVPPQPLPLSPPFPQPIHSFPPAPIPPIPPIPLQTSTNSRSQLSQSSNSSSFQTNSFNSGFVNDGGLSVGGLNHSGQSLQDTGQFQQYNTLPSSNSYPNTFSANNSSFPNNNSYPNNSSSLYSSPLQQQSSNRQYLAGSLQHSDSLSSMHLQGSPPPLQTSPIVGQTSHSHLTTNTFPPLNESNVISPSLYQQPLPLNMTSSDTNAPSGLYNNFRPVDGLVTGTPPILGSTVPGLDMSSVGTVGSVGSMGPPSSNPNLGIPAAPGSDIMSPPVGNPHHYELQPGEIPPHLINIGVSQEVVLQHSLYNFINGASRSQLLYCLRACLSDEDLKQLLQIKAKYARPENLSLITQQLRIPTEDILNRRYRQLEKVLFGQRRR